MRGWSELTLSARDVANHARRRLSGRQKTNGRCRSPSALALCGFQRGQCAARRLSGGTQGLTPQGLTPLSQAAERQPDPLTCADGHPDATDLAR